MSDYVKYFRVDCQKFIYVVSVGLKPGEAPREFPTLMPCLCGDAHPYYEITEYEYDQLLDQTLD